MIELRTDSHVYVSNDTEYKNKCTEDRIYVNSDQILRLRKDDRIYLDYGKIELVVERVGGMKFKIIIPLSIFPLFVFFKWYWPVNNVDTDEVYCTVKRGEYLRDETLVHIPGIPIGMTMLTDKDKENIRTGIRLKVDIIMVPGVRNGEFFNQVKRFCKWPHVVENEG